MDAYERLCPACERADQDYPAGTLHIGGAFAAANRDEIVALLRNVEERESAEHPLKRILDLREEDGGLLVSTSDEKLVRALGRALKRAYAGTLREPPTRLEGGRLVRVQWVRD